MNIIPFLSSPLAVKRDSCYYIARVYVRACVPACMRAYVRPDCPDIYAWISKLFNIVLFLRSSSVI